MLAEVLGLRFFGMSLRCVGGVRSARLIASSRRRAISSWLGASRCVGFLVMSVSYRRVGRCIYCGSTEEPLTREHVVPRGLGGNRPPIGLHEAVVLRKATCEPCRRITHKLETECQDRMMGNFRSRFGFSKNPRSLDPGLPTALMLPNFSHAGILNNEPVRTSYNVRIRSVVQNSERPALVLPPGESTAVAGIEPSRFAQMLAKIALGFAVYKLGVDGFRPLVQDFVRFGPYGFGHWVGGPVEDELEPPSNRLHELIIADAGGGDSGDWVLVYVRLFASYGGPRNYVVVGRPL